LKKGVPYVWTEVTELAFQQLKQALIIAPVLALPDFSKQFVLETDASAVGFGAVLMQSNHPIAYLSKVVCPKNQALSTYEKECMSILLAMDKWRAYLQGQEFIIKTDHRSLLHILDQRVATKMHQKAILKLMDLQYKIVYKQGHTNLAADAQSRCQQEYSVCAVSTLCPEWLDKVKLGYQDDPKVMKLLAELSLGEVTNSGFSLKDGIIRLNGRLWLGENKIAQQHILQVVHQSGVGATMGFFQPIIS
jgi:hypothetical protein